MASDKDSVRRVVMSKRVATDYLKDRSTFARSVTVFFNRDDTFDRLHSEVTSTGQDRFASKRGFDRVTYFSENDDFIDYVKTCARRLGLEFDDF